MSHIKWLIKMTHSYQQPYPWISWSFNQWFRTGFTFKTSSLYIFSNSSRRNGSHISRIKLYMKNLSFVGQLNYYSWNEDRIYSSCFFSKWWNEFRNLSNQNFRVLFQESFPYHIHLNLSQNEFNFKKEENRVPLKEGWKLSTIEI